MKGKHSIRWAMVLALSISGVVAADFIPKPDPALAGKGWVLNFTEEDQARKNVARRNWKLGDEGLTFDSDGITVGRERRDFNLDVGGERFELPEDQRARDAYHSDSVLDLVPSLRLRMGF